MLTEKNIIYPGIFLETPLKLLKFSQYINTWIKDESVNSTGTHKDRMAFELLKNYRQYYKTVLPSTSVQPPSCSLISAGNAALAVALLFKEYGLPKLKVLLDISVNKKCVDFLNDNHCQVFTTNIFEKPLSKENILALTENQTGLDITSYSLTDNGNQLYANLVESILKTEPATIIVPYGSGILFESFCKGIIQRQAVKSNNKTCTLIGVTTKHKYSKANKLYSAYAPFDHNASRLHFMKLFGYIKSQSHIYSISEDYLDEAVNLLKMNSIDAEYSGAAGLAYLLETKNTIPTTEHCVIVNTGKGLLDRFLEK